jgi:hypothetical protein
MVPAHARTSLLGAMQRPPLDGPVDRRSVGVQVRTPTLVDGTSA